jgi:uncharacterized protein (TIGR02147 family)
LIEKIATHLRVHQSLVSQVLAGKKDFSEEQAYRVGQFFKMDEREIEYLLTLVRLARTTMPELRALLERQLEQLRAPEESSKLDSELKTTPLSEAEHSVFYSSWYYSAVRLLSSLPGHHTPAKIAEYLGLSVGEVRAIADFLVKAGLCVERNGQLSLGPKRTLVSSGSPALARHHLNWRLRAIESHQRSPHLPVAYTAPMTLSRADADKIRALLWEAIWKIEPMIEPSPSEALFCLNIDWFEVK